MFLTQENAQTILQFLSKFMMDKYQFKILANISEPELRKILGETMVSVQKKYASQYPEDTLMKITVSELKEHFKTIFQLGASSLEVSPPIVSMQIPSPILQEPLNTIHEEENVEGISEDSEFFNKLQRLELQRKTTVFTPAPAEPILQTPSQVSSAPIVAPSTIQTVFMPSPPKIGKEVKIFSWQRNWIQQPNRNAFTWNGPLPRMQDNTNTRIGCFIGPSYLLNYGNMLSLTIEGANEDMTSVTLIPSHSVGSHTIYKAALDSLGYLRLLALPWKITLESMDGEEIPLGKDGYDYQVLYSDLVYSRIYVKDASHEFSMGDVLRVYNEKTKKILPSKILRVGEHEIEIEGAYEGTGKLLHFNQQISILLEMMSTEHKN